MKRTFVILVCVAWSAGCSSDKHASSTQPADTWTRQDSALKDPFGYSPNMKDDDVSGGDLGHFDRDAMNKDIDHVLNP